MSSRFPNKLRSTNQDEFVLPGLSRNDVALGRGTGVNRHAGCRRFRSKVAQYSGRYDKLRDGQKMELAAEIVAEVATEGGGFYEKDATGAWAKVSFQRAQNKAQALLREHSLKTRRRQANTPPRTPPSITTPPSTPMMVSRALITPERQVVPVLASSELAASIPVVPFLATESNFHPVPASPPPHLADDNEPWPVEDSTQESDFASFFDQMNAVMMSLVTATAFDLENVGVSEDDYSTESDLDDDSDYCREIVSLLLDD